MKPIPSRVFFLDKSEVEKIYGQDYLQVMVLYTPMIELFYLQSDMLHRFLWMIEKIRNSPR